ncbi:MAG: hypothetical protein JWM53_3570 [bacterium]|nr:hypothetical protein [bacterium]
MCETVLVRIVVLALVVCTAGGCRFRVSGSAADLAGDVDATSGDASDLGGMDLGGAPDLAVGPDLLMPGALTAAHATTPANVSLSSEGLLDWAHFGLVTAADVNRKAGGPAAIGLASVGTVKQWPSYTPTSSWTGGAPTASATTASGVYIDSSGGSFTLTVPADTTTRNVSLYLSQFESTGTLVAHLSDDSAPDYTVSTPVTATTYHRYTLTFRAAQAAQTLRVTWTLTAGTGSVDLIAATYY